MMQQEMQPVFETARMYTKGLPATRTDHCIGDDVRARLEG
jgi:hypothetical protein